MPKKQTEALPKLPRLDLKMECRECGKALGMLDANHKTILTALGCVRNKHTRTLSNSPRLPAFCRVKQAGNPLLP